MLKLTSIVDTITNSSDELFIMKSGDQDKKTFLIDFIKSLDTIDDEKKEEIIKLIEDDYFRYEVCYNVDEKVLVEINSLLDELVCFENKIIPVELLQNWYDRIFEDIKNGVIKYYDEDYANSATERMKLRKEHIEEYVYNPQLHMFNYFNDNRDEFFPNLEVLIEYKERYQDIFDWLINFFKDKLVIYGVNSQFSWYIDAWKIEDYEKYDILCYAHL